MMYLIESVGTAILAVLKWTAIIAGSLLAPSIGIWAIIKLTIYIIKKSSPPLKNKIDLHRSKLSTTGGKVTKITSSRS